MTFSPWNHCMDLIIDKVLTISSITRCVNKVFEYIIKDGYNNKYIYLKRIVRTGHFAKWKIIVALAKFSSIMLGLKVVSE